LVGWLVFSVIVPYVFVHSGKGTTK